MKRRFIPLLSALLLALAILISSCSGEGGDETADTVITSSAETTAAAAETTAEETTGETTAIDSETYVFNPSDAEDFTFLKSSKSESLAASSNDSLLCAERDLLLSSTYGLAVKERISTNLISEVSAGYNSGDGYELLLLDAVSEASQLLCSGLLENLDTAGINLNAESSCAVGTLTSDFEIAGKTYLLAFKGLTCDLRNAYVLEVLEDGKLYASLSAAFAEDSFSFSKLLSVLTDINADECAFIRSDSANDSTAALLRAAGGVVMISGGTNAGGSPEVNISSDSFGSAYNNAVNVMGFFGEEDAKLLVCPVSEITDAYAAVLPLPQSEPGSGYVSPVSAGKLTVVAATKGIVYGRRAAAALNAISECSAKIRGSVVTLTGPEADRVKEIVESTVHSDAAGVFTWGDLLELAVGDLTAYKNYTSFMAEKDIKNRIKVAAQAAEIIVGRLK